MNSDCNIPHMYSVVYSSAYLQKGQIVFLHVVS